MRILNVFSWIAITTLAAAALSGCAQVNITPDSATLTVNTTVALAATSTDPLDGAFAWFSGDQSIATVDASGMVTGQAAGSVDITATGDHSGATGTAHITVLAEGEGEGEGENEGEGEGEGETSTHDNLVFIHHSVGQNWLDHSLNAALLAKTYIDERNDITYGTVVSPDTGRPDSLAPVPGDTTDMNQWVLWFNDYLDHVKTFDCQQGVNRIIMFKSCFPNSYIEEDGAEPGDPFDGYKTLANYRAVYRHPDGSGHTYQYGGQTYQPLEDVFAANPNTLFIPVTAPPQCWNDTDTTIARRARTFNNWLKNEWLPAYIAATGLHNVAVFDLFDVLANPNDASSNANELRQAYGGDSGDSHPNDAGNAQLTQVFATGSNNFLDRAWAAFGGGTEGEGETAGLVEVPDPLATDNPLFTLGTPDAPVAGQSVPDADFGLAQTRVTQTPKMRHEYSRHDPFNHDQSMILLQNVGTGDWFVYRTQSIPYDKASQQIATVSLEEPRWDPTDPNLLWGTTAFRIVTMDMDHPAADPVVVKDFAADSTIQPILASNPDIYHITMKDEGESSADKRYWAFILQGSAEEYRARYIFTWDRLLDQILGVYPVLQDQSDIDWAGMSVKGNWVLIGGMDTNAAPLTGLTMADKQFTQFHRLDFATAHADVGLDSDGNEVIVMQNVRTDYIDLIPIDPSTQPILEASGAYTGTNRTPLVRLYYTSEANGLNSGIHISCNTPGYCVVSTSIASGAPAQNWLDRKIIVVKLDRARPRAFYLAKVYGTDDSYWEETHASITNDGAKVIWATNWGLNPGQEDVWDMALNMPANWQAALAK
jgi:hypothetical protein